MKNLKIKTIIGILGSPRKGGNTDILLDEALKAARGKGAKTKKIILNELKFSPCQECENIRKDGVCIIKDDWQMTILGNRKFRRNNSRISYIFRKCFCADKDDDRPFPVSVACEKHFQNL